MHVITPSPQYVTTTPAAVMTGLAAPSRGSAELSTWQVRMAPASTGPEHAIDREQVWMLTSGSIEVTSGGRTQTVSAGQAVVLPAHALRQIRTGEEPAEALVAMPAGDRAHAPGSAADRPLPWAC
ncbi:cupin domain-containing protein [Streptomyces zagrosensis]|uniref:Quercetin dioxygenase-like cupin family protein n=1 Tax=Streptomyces zagrosensis TaxID=1042984 RepID=A0A7W9QFV7_9ACTN|nr:cupin domain-containing protein [Streptomyces zagrosensis]MBB5938457.1 quercetin dioxygenase-like cupin family protein [Streptomyces zagrosensis]